MSKIREYFSAGNNLPLDVTMNLPRISICGDKEVYIENHKGFVEYTDSDIRIKMKDGVVHIHGKNLRIVVMKTDRMVVNGDFCGIEYEKVGRKIKNVQKNL